MPGNESPGGFREDAHSLENVLSVAGFSSTREGQSKLFSDRVYQTRQAAGQEPWPACAAGCTPKPIDSLSSAAVRIRKNLGFEVRKAEV